MGKKDEYRFNLRFDETDEMHRLVVKYLNSCGHKSKIHCTGIFGILENVWQEFAFVCVSRNRC